MQKSITLVYDPICPFAQRVWLTLLQKKIPFNKMVVSIRDKSQQFKDIHKKSFAADLNSVGVVPILIYGQQTFSESEIINWLLCQQFETGTQLIPKDNIQKFKMRWFMKNITNKFVGAFYSTKGMVNKSQEQQDKTKIKVIQTLKQLNQNIVGPYVLGESISLADLMFYPWLQRWLAQKETYGIAIPAECKKIHDFMASMEQRDSVKETQKETSPEFFIANYKPYLLGQWQST